MLQTIMNVLFNKGFIVKWHIPGKCLVVNGNTTTTNVANAILAEFNNGETGALTITCKVGGIFIYQ